MGMTDEAAQWFSEHLKGPDNTGAMFHCWWCGGNAMKHNGTPENPCPYYLAEHQISGKTDDTHKSDGG